MLFINNGVKLIQTLLLLDKAPPAAPNMNGPVRDGNPIDWANSPVTPTKLGPATAPNVVNTIVVLIAVARCLLLAKSVPA